MSCCKSRSCKMRCCEISCKSRFRMVRCCGVICCRKTCRELDADRVSEFLNAALISEDESEKSMDLSAANWNDVLRLNGGQEACKVEDKIMCCSRKIALMVDEGRLDNWGLDGFAKGNRCGITSLCFACHSWSWSESGPTHAIKT